MIRRFVWHSHGCYKSTVPKSRREFWQDKFEASRERDARNVRLLRDRGWRVLSVWECVLKRKTAEPAEDAAGAVKAWLESDETLGEIASMTPAVVSFSRHGVQR